MTETEVPIDGRIRDHHGNTFYGVALDQNEDGDWFAAGHIEPRRMAAAMSAYNRTIIGEPLEGTYADVVGDLKHQWGRPYTLAELKATADDWVWGYHEFEDEPFPGAVPVTVVRWT